MLCTSVVCIDAGGVFLCGGTQLACFLPTRSPGEARVCTLYRLGTITITMLILFVSARLPRQIVWAARACCEGADETLAIAVRCHSWINKADNLPTQF